MDYTTPTRVKLEAQISVSTQDTLIAALVTAVSRAMDRKATGATNGAENYFELDDVVDELLIGRLDNTGNIVCAPHKPQINSVASMSYRLRPIDSWTEVSSSAISIDGPFVTGWLELSTPPAKVWVKISYNGGYAAAVADLPADLQEVATALAIRYFKEAEAGLNDAMGIAEIGVFIYSKAWPQRVKDMFQPFIRPVGWNSLS